MGILDKKEPKPVLKADDVTIGAISAVTTVQQGPLGVAQGTQVFGAGSDSKLYMWAGSLKSWILTQ